MPADPKAGPWPIARRRTGWKDVDQPTFGPLQGVRIVHSTASLAGPFGPLLMSEYGAEVIWIENAAAPDLGRFGRGWNMENYRHNMRAMALDIPSPEGREVFAKLIKDADVFVESYKGGQMVKWSLDDEALWEINPALVIARVSGYGQSGDPDFVPRPSFDAIAQAFSGFTFNNIAPGQAPYPVGPFAADYVTALFQTIGVLAALYRAKQTGIGESVDVAQFECMLKIMDSGADWFTDHHRIATAGEPSAMAGWGCFPCKDGAYVQLCLIGGGILKKAIPFLGLDPAEFPDTAILYKSDEAGQKFAAAIDEFLASRTADEVQDQMQGAGLPVSKVNDLVDLETNPHVQARSTVIEYETQAGKPVRVVGPVPAFKREPGRVWRGAPGYGNDNEAILGELGYTPEQIAELYDKRIIAKDTEGKYVTTPWV